jgi:hypothetical protein
MLKAGAPAIILLLGAAAAGFSSPAAAQDETPAPNGAAVEQATVSIGRRTSVVGEPFARRPDGPSDAFSIARDAQAELRRVGCYEGEVNGFWSSSSRMAAQRFLDRVNAKLPVDKPEDALLALLRGKNDHVCGQCPRGEALDPAGRCMPTALLKRSAASVVTGSLSDLPGVPVHAHEERPSSEQESAATAGQRSKPKPPGYWGRLMWKFDRALGLN